MASSPLRTDGPPAGVGDDVDAPLRSYVRTKQAIGLLLRELYHVAERSTPWISERAHDLIARLAEDRFQLVVVGQFKRGKSSLMNAIVGSPLLPTGTIPVTSVVTSLRYGPHTRAVIRRAGRVLDEEIPIESLGEFVTERGNPENRKQILSADVEVRVPFLRRGLRFVDTPGIGSAHEPNTAATLAFVPEADAAIFVTGADAPLTQSELEFLDTIRQHVRKLFFVLNKIDQVAAPDREEVVTYTSRILASRLGLDAICVFALSAAQAVNADPANEDARAASGLPALEAALATFLDRERRTVFLVALLDRALRLLDEMRSTSQRGGDATARTGNSRSVTEVSPQLDSLHARALAARDNLLAGRRLAPASAADTAPPPPHLAVPLEPSARSQPQRRVTGTCTICAAMSGAVYDFLCHHQYAITVDGATQRGFVATRGLCPTHTWHLERVASPRGLADSYPLLLDDTAARLESAIGLPTAGVRKAIDRLLGRTTLCPACQTGHRAEQSAAGTLLRRLAESQAPLGNQWVCLNHLRLLLSEVDEECTVGLVRDQARRLRDVAEAMREYVLKMDARRSELITDDEARAYHQGLVLLSGGRYLVVTEPDE